MKLTVMPDLSGPGFPIAPREEVEMHLHRHAHILLAELHLVLRMVDLSLLEISEMSAISTRVYPCCLAPLCPLRSRARARRWLVCARCKTNRARILFTCLLDGIITLHFQS